MSLNRTSNTMTEIGPKFPRAILLCAAFVVPVFAQEYIVPPNKPYVRIHGEATVSAVPDRAQLDIGVISQSATAKGATDLNTKQSNAVTDQLRTLVNSENLKTVNFSINPNYQYPKDGGPATILGYTANNTVRVELDDISQVRKVIEIATKAGANNVNRLNFALKDEAKSRAEALGLAATQARQGAEALAASLKLRLGIVLRVEEGQPVIVSPARQIELSTTKSAAREPAIEPGNIQIHASVNITFELIQ